MKKVLLIIFIGMLPILGISQTTKCKDITKKIDDFNGEISFNAKVSSLSKSPYDISFIKIKDKDIIQYYLSIYIASYGIHTGEGVYIILENGEKISKPNEKVGYELIGSFFYTTAFMQLTDLDITLLKESGIKKFKLYITDAEISDKLTKKSKELLNCLVVVE